MNAIKLTTNIPENRKISFDVPADVPVGPVEIIFIYQDRKNNLYDGMIEKACGSLQGSHFNTERYKKLKQDDKELER